MSSIKNVICSPDCPVPYESQLSTALQIVSSSYTRLSVTSQQQQQQAVGMQLSALCRPAAAAERTVYVTLGAENLMSDMSQT